MLGIGCLVLSGPPRQFFLWLSLFASRCSRGGRDEAGQIKRGRVHSGGEANDLLTAWVINQKMAKSLFNQVLLEYDFVLELSNEIKNQSLVSYLNLIYNLIV